MEFVATHVWQREGCVPLADAGQIGRQVGEPMGDEMHHLTFALDATVDPDHAGRQDELEQFGFALLETVFPAPKGIRLLGVTLSSLAEESYNEGQLRLSL